MTLGCPNCGCIVIEQGLRAALGLDWLCARCCAGGTFHEQIVGDRVIRVRQTTVTGDPSLTRDWVPAESMPYAERVRPIGGER